nr:MAG TPA: hypothetical protein [Caudoviricetes sp.]
MSVDLLARAMAAAAIQGEAAAGDMKRSVYDGTGAVAAKGGIAGYVSGAIADKQDKTSDELTTTAKSVVGAINELKTALNALSKVTSDIEVVAEKPEAPKENVLYYVGTEAPYQIWFYEHETWYDMGTTEVNLTNYVTTEALTAALNGYVPTTRTVNGKELSADIELKPADVGAVPVTGGTMTGDLTIAPEGRTSILTDTMGSGANIVIKENDNALTVMTFSPTSKSIILADGTTQDPIILRGVAEPQIDTDAVNKYYVDNKIIVATHTIHSLSLDAAATHTEQVSVALPTGITSVGYDFYATINGNNLAALLSITRTEAVASSSGSWLRTTYLAYNPSGAAVTGDVVITVICIQK